MDAQYLFRSNGIAFETQVFLLRYMPEHIWFNPEQVVAEIRAVLAASQRSRT
ncbi:hypothetical protein [Pseudarthrobacter sp. NBSH8]|uniref:hypothetical protein n=1 Tax=Pseudarthrobacter sp. NBSH8 TaxID=2596911 RepID=UPI001629B33C|nr:hypothetical protein [Pseudarthrobacter sp. NBSH8]